MAMAESRKSTKPRTFEVLVSFSNLDKGDRFTQEVHDLDWANQHVETGYLRDVTEEPTVEVAQDGGAVGQG
jgi:hypothetical protein